MEVRMDWRPYRYSPVVGDKDATFTADIVELGLVGLGAEAGFVGRGDINTATT